MSATKTKLYAMPQEIVRNEEQPRTYFAAEDLRALGESLRTKQRQPITVVPCRLEGRPEVKWKIVDGERRWRAGQSVKLQKLWIVVDDDVQDEEELHTASFTANFCRAGHTHRETAAAIQRELDAGKKFAEIAAMVGKTEIWARNEHSLLKLHPDVLKLVDPPTPKEEKLPLKVALLLASQPREKQMALWRKYKHKPTSEAFHHIRTDAPTVKDRRAVDDALYITGRAKSVLTTMKAIAGLPAAMTSRLNAEQRAKVAGSLREAAGKALEVAELLQAGAEVDEE